MISLSRPTSVIVGAAVVWLTGSSLVLGQATMARTVWDKVYTEAQAKRGEAAYVENCSECHGEDLSGAGNAPSLSGDDFIFQWGDQSVGDLFERIRTLMPSDRPNSLSPDVYRDIVTFILRANKFPSGDTDLATDLEGLKQIKITKAHP
jgi:mono/diheme cytochrome c family protein